MHTASQPASGASSTGEGALLTHNFTSLYGAAVIVGGVQSGVAPVTWTVERLNPQAAASSLRSQNGSTHGLA